MTKLLMPPETTRALTTTSMSCEKRVGSAPFSQGVQQHQLSADQRPLLQLCVRQFQQGSPERVVVAGIAGQRQR